MLEKVDSCFTWDDLVLPAGVTSRLRDLAGEAGLRRGAESWEVGAKLELGGGITALFTGPSGIGKTMAAQVLSNELGVDLYRVDFSAIVSKYIGETEKNLGRVFDIAEQNGWILFFDEADALFGKRTEVKDSHDRYANLEISYALQRMESYPGLAILTTNKTANLDEAFLRRLRYVVDFERSES